MTEAASSTANPSAFEKKLQEQAATTVTQLVTTIASSLASWGKDKLAVRTATKRYAESYRERHGQIHPLGMSKPIPLHEIYTAVRIVPRDFLGAFTDHDQMEQAFKQCNRQHGSFQSDKVEDGIEVANREQCLNLLGAPGAGKSTFLRRLGQEAMLARKASESIDPQDTKLHSHYEHALLPVYLELRVLKSKPLDLVALLAEEFSNAHFPEGRKFVEAALAHGKLLVLLDGLDEVPNDKLDATIDHIKDFVDKHAAVGNRFVTSCRTAHYKSAFPRFIDMVVADFSDEQIAHFAENWFCSLAQRQTDTAEAFVAVLHDAANAASLELARTPLLLTFLCLTYANGQELPPTRAALYRRALELLLREWAASKRVHDEPVYRELNAELELDMLAEFAESLFREDRFFFNKQRVTTHIRTFMSQQLNAPKSLDAEKILEAIEVQQGLIVKRANDTYSFSHLTIQEYLTAKKLWDDGETAWTLAINEHLADSRWGVVLESLVGMGNSDPIFRAISEACSRLLRECERKDEVISAILTYQHCSQTHTNSTPLTTASAKLILVARTLASTTHALDHAVISLNECVAGRSTITHNHMPFTLHNIDSRGIVRALGIHRDFASNQAFIFDDAANLDRALAREIVLALDLALDLDRPTFFSGPIVDAFDVAINSRDPLLLKLFGNLSGTIQPATLRILKQYLKQLGVMFRCKRSAYRLSSATWAEVCGAILSLPPNECDQS